MRSLIKLALLLTGLSILAGVGMDPARAAEEKAEIVFSNGGRIVSAKADGTDRRVIFGVDRNPKNDGLGAVEPAASPDGQTVVFSFARRSGGELVHDIWLVGIDGSGPRRLLSSNKQVQYGDPTFLPDGRVVVAFFRAAGKAANTGLISIGPDGTGSRRLLDIRQPRRPYKAPVAVIEPDVSADGGRILYLVDRGYSGSVFGDGFENDLMVLNLATGKRRRVTSDAYGATWSPNGQRIAFSQQTDDDDLEICWWETGCDFEGALAVINADGTGRRFITGKGIDERSPDWSADNRIVFQSARNLPGIGEANEIYSVDPSGKCLTKLTNGSPASLTPAWAGPPAASTAPSGCAAAPPDSGVEIKLPPRLGTDTGTFWLGERPGTRLLTDVYDEAGASMFLYLDCDRERRADCQRPLAQWSVDVCTYRGVVAEAFSEPAIRSQRGVPIFRSGGSEMGPFTYLFAGRSAIFFSGGSGKGAQAGSKEVALLRRTDQDEAGMDLSPAKFPAFDIQRMRQISGLFAKNHSIGKTAARLKLAKRKVRENLKFARRIKVYGEYETVKCPRRSGPKTKVVTETSSDTARELLPG